MRITNNSSTISYETNLNNILESQFTNNMKMTTSKDIINLSDSPDKVMDVKKLAALLDQNGKYETLIDQTTNEMQAVGSQLESISNSIEQLRQVAIDASNVGNAGNLFTLGTEVKGIIGDIVKNANFDYNGHYVFSGTQTTPASIKITPPATNNSPFELIQGTATATNASGLQVIFKGNTNDRIINKDQKSTEVINVKSDEVFGTGGTQFFDSAIKLYNLMSYNADGTVRKNTDTFSKDDIAKLNQYQKELADISLGINNASGKNGIKINRLDSVKDQMVSEDLILKDIRSLKEDANVSQVALNLKKDDNALQYTLQVGPQMIQNTLFDFLK